MDSVGRRIQGLQRDEQVLILSRLAQGRASEGLFAPVEVEQLFDDIGLPRPANVSNYLAKLERSGLLMRVKKARGAAWKLTPEGRGQAEELATDIDIAALLAEAARPVVTLLGATAHPVIPPSLAPPDLVGPLHDFLNKYPFERNVFGMTRFPAEADKDPLAASLEAASAVCERHGLVFHLASQRSIVDDLWANVAAHMWGCRYGVAFFEARTERGLNYNLSIEVGSCLVLGRRLALLKDSSLEAMPTDLVGRIYRGVDISDPRTVTRELEDWVTATLRLGNG
jgi:hypothetical protein